MPEIICQRPLTNNQTTGFSRYIYHLITAFNNGKIARDEYKQQRDFYLGLDSLKYHTDNLITRRLWRGLHLPLGLIKCTDGQWRHIATIAKNGRRQP